MNQTMAQIVQGKDTELFPLVDKKKVGRDISIPYRQQHQAHLSG